MNRRIEHNEEGYHIFDDTGKERGRYRSANELATHLAFAFRELDALRRRIATDQIFNHLGIGI